MKNYTGFIGINIKTIVLVGSISLTFMVSGCSILEPKPLPDPNNPSTATIDLESGRIVVRDSKGNPIEKRTRLSAEDPIFLKEIHDVESFTVIRGKRNPHVITICDHTGCWVEET